MSVNNEVIKELHKRVQSSFLKNISNSYVYITTSEMCVFCDVTINNFFFSWCYRYLSRILKLNILHRQLSDYSFFHRLTHVGNEISKFSQKPVELRIICLKENVFRLRIFHLGREKRKIVTPKNGF